MLQNNETTIKVIVVPIRTLSELIQQLKGRPNLEDKCSLSSNVGSCVASDALKAVFSKYMTMNFQ